MQLSLRSSLVLSVVVSGALVLSCSPATDPAEGGDGDGDGSGTGGAGSGGVGSGGVGAGGLGSGGVGTGGLGSGGLGSGGVGAGGLGSGGDLGGGTGGGGTGGLDGTGGVDGSGGDSGSDCASLPVCDDFESVAVGGPPDAALWVVDAIAGGTSVTVSNEEFVSGSQSLKVVGASSGPAYATNTSAFPAPSGAIYFRTWIKYTDANWMGHITFIESGPTADPNTGDEVRLGGQNNYYHANLGNDGDGLSPDPFEYPTCGMCVAPTANEWACLAGGFDPATNTVTLSVNGVTAVNAMSADDWHSGSGTLPASLSRLSFGWESYGAGVANTMYFDDIAIGYAPLACP